MNKFYKIIFSLLLILCFGLVGRNGQNYGEITLNKPIANKKTNYVPSGMVLVQGGFFNSGSYEDRRIGIYTSNALTGVHDFFMDAMPISNKQYREFLEFVERSKYGKVKILNDSSQNSLSGDNLRSDLKGSKQITKKEEEDDENDSDEDDDYEEDDEEESKKIDETQINVDANVINNKKLKKKNFSELDEDALEEHHGNKEVYYKNILVSPDLNAWQILKGSSEVSNNIFVDVLSQEYHTANAYDIYPVVCVSRQAAEEFVKWRTMILRSYRKRNKLNGVPVFRLPTDVEYSYAQRGGEALPRFSFGGPHARSNNGSLLCNFKSKSNVYGECGFLGPSPSGLFRANGYGLFDMSGNVACWLSNLLVRKAPDNQETTSFFAMGGSWGHIAYYSEVGILYERNGSPDPRIGFRCVMTCIGA